MKRTIAYVILFAMVLCLFGCAQKPEQSSANNEPPTVEGFQVGYGRVDVTPAESVPISGLGRSSMRMSTSVHDLLYATCIAVTDAEGETMLMFTVDTQHSYDSVFVNARTLVSQKTGIPEDHIFFTATHTHSGPDLNNAAEPTILAYRERLALWMVDAAELAITDRKPAMVSYGSVETEGMNFVRHYVNVNIDGTLNYFGDNYGSAVLDSTTRHTTEADPTMHVVRFERPAGKDIVLVNWRAHPHVFTAANSYKLSADFIGSFRSTMEDLNDCHFAYFQGAAGNINNASRIASENQVLNKDYGQYGYVMAQYCSKALENMTPSNGEDVKVIQLKKELEVDHDEDHLVAYAVQVQSLWNSGNSQAQVNEFGLQYGIHSPYHANYIVSNSKRPATITSELNAVSVGDTISFVTAPHELFDTQSVWLEEHSPYELTMMFCYTNGANSYVPSDYVYEYGSYECDAAFVRRGSAEILQEQYLEMLNSLMEQ